MPGKGINTNIKYQISNIKLDIGYWKLEIGNSWRNQAGFTLVEILISIAVISVAGVVILPNLLSFNSDQQLKNTVSELKNTIKNASSKASNNIKCNETTPSKSWVVNIENPSTPSPPGFNLVAICDDAAKTRVTHYQAPPASPEVLILPSSSSCTSYPVALTFESGVFTYTCKDQPPVTGEFSITLKDKNTGTQSVIKVTKEGVASEQ